MSPVKSIKNPHNQQTVDWSLEQYKLLVDHSQKLNEIIQKANDFYSGINTTLMAVTVSLLNFKWIGQEALVRVSWILITIGILFSLKWYKNIRVGIEKEKIHLGLIRELEKKLTFTPFTSIYDYGAISHKSFFSKELGTLPLFFIGFYIIGGIVVLFLPDIKVQ